MANDYRNKVIADGAVAYWRLGEASGTVARSEIGSFDGTISGGVTLAQPGALADGNKAMAFNGTTGKIVTAANVTIPVTSTIEAWIKTTAPGPRAIVSTRNPPYPVGRVYFSLENGRVFLYADGMGTANTKVLNDGVWHHVASTLNGSTCTTYVDGVVDHTDPIPRLTVSGVPLSIGWDSEAPNFFSGSIDEVAIYPTALTPAQITAHYNLRTATNMPAWHDLRYRYCRYVAPRRRVRAR